MSLALAFATSPDNWRAAYRLANLLLRAGVAVGWALEPFTAGSRPVPLGAFVVPLETDGWTGSSPAGDDVGAIVQTFARTSGVTVTPASPDVPLLPLGVPRIAIYGGGGAPYNYARIFSELGFVIEFITPQAIRRGALADVDVLAVPGGGLQAMKGQLDPLGSAGCEAVARWVRDGGMYVGSCAGAYDAAVVPASFTALCPQQTCMRLINARVWNDQDTEFVGLASPGVGVLQARVARTDHPVTFNLPAEFEIAHYNGPVFTLVAGTVDGASEAIGLCALSGVTERFTPAEYFLRFSQYSPGADDTLITRAIAAGMSNVVAGYLERGRVVLFGSHPEFGLTLPLDTYATAAILLANAAFWQSAFRPRRTVRLAETRTAMGPALTSGLAAARVLAEQVKQRVDALRVKPVEPGPAWLREQLAMSTFGLSGRQIWTDTLEQFARLQEEFHAALRALEDVVRGARRFVGNGPSRRAFPADIRATLENIQAAIFYRVPAEWRQDFGYEGLLQTMERCAAMLDQALAQWHGSPVPTPNPYAHFEMSPYHLVAGSYLAAVGVFANAVHLLRALHAQVVLVQELAGLAEPRRRPPARRRVGMGIRAAESRHVRKRVIRRNHGRARDG